MNFVHDLLNPLKFNEKQDAQSFLKKNPHYLFYFCAHCEVITSRQAHAQLLWSALQCCKVTVITAVSWVQRKMWGTGTRTRTRAWNREDQSSFKDLIILSILRTKIKPSCFDRLTAGESGIQQGRYGGRLHKCIRYKQEHAVESTDR